MRETLLRVERLLRRPLSHTDGVANDSSVNETYFAGGYGPVSERLFLQRLGSGLVRGGLFVNCPFNVKAQR